MSGGSLSFYRIKEFVRNSQFLPGYRQNDIRKKIFYVYGSRAPYSGFYRDLKSNIDNHIIDKIEKLYEEDVSLFKIV